MILTGGDETGINSISLENITHPKYNLLSDVATGLKILTNDTEQTQVYIDSYTFDENTGEWEAAITLKITDHFGLGNDDLEKFRWIYGFNV